MTITYYTQTKQKETHNMTITNKTRMRMLQDNGYAIDKYYKELQETIGKEDDRSVWATNQLIDHLEYLYMEAVLLELSIIKNKTIELYRKFPPIKGFF